MPTYDYKCESCNHEFEKVQSITANPVKECPECGEDAVNRMVSSGVGIIFKGSGFYSTDYKNAKSRSSKAESDAPACASSCPSASEACSTN